MALIDVMIVENDRAVLADIQTIIDWKEEGFNIVATAVNGKQGLNKFLSYRPKVVITDVRLPVMDGLEMMHEIKEIDKSIIVFIISAYKRFRFEKTEQTFKTEIFRKMIKNTLENVKMVLAAQYEAALNYAKATIIELVLDPGSGVRTDELAGAFRTLSDYENDQSCDILRSFASMAVRTQYAALAISAEYEEPKTADLDTLYVWLVNEIEYLRGIAQGRGDRQYSPLIQNAVSFIKNHYSDPELKIDTIAKHINISPGRLCVLFKDETDTTINDYITSFRINAAKKLLLTGRYKVYEVSELVGYRTSQYFSQVFFGYTGQQPSKYRSETS